MSHILRTPSCKVKNKVTITPGGSVVKKGSACQAGDSGSIPSSGEGEGNGNPLQYSCLGNPMDRGAWQGIVHGVAKEDMTYWWTTTSAKDNVTKCDVLAQCGGLDSAQWYPRCWAKSFTSLLPFVSSHEDIRKNMKKNWYMYMDNWIN